MPDNVGDSFAVLWLGQVEEGCVAVAAFSLPF